MLEPIPAEALLTRVLGAHVSTMEERCETFQLEDAISQGPTDHVIHVAQSCDWDYEEWDKFLEELNYGLFLTKLPLKISDEELKKMFDEATRLTEIMSKFHDLANVRRRKFL